MSPETFLTWAELLRNVFPFGNGVAMIGGAILNASTLFHHLKCLCNLCDHTETGSKDEIQSPCHKQAGDADQRLRHRPSAQRLGHAQAESFLHDPKAGIIEM